MARFRLSRLTLFSRIILFVIAFGAVMLLELGIGHYQSRYVLRPLEERTEKIQTISQFLNAVESCMGELEDYRWDYGDAGALTESLRSSLAAAGEQLSGLRSDIREDSEDFYLLANASQTTYGTLTDQIDGIVTALAEGRTAAATRIYYNAAAPCGTYLLQYTRQLLERAILDNHDAFISLRSLNDTLNRVQTVTLILCIVFGLAMTLSLVSLLRSVMQMSQASQRISEGDLDTPDVDASRQDEIGRMARAFNDMKRSMKRQMEILNEKNAMERELHAKKTEALELQNLMEREKLQQLRSQINPHFLFNTLNVILYTAKQEQAEETQKLLTSLSRMFRYALVSNEAEVPLSREVQIVDEFYALYHARFGDRVRLDWHIAPDIDLTETVVPSFILQPLVENAFKHGLSPKEEDGRVDIYMDVENGLLNIRVIDDGVGMTQEALTKLLGNLREPPTTGDHIGLYNVAARLRLRGEDYGLDVQSQHGTGTTAIMTLPLVTASEEEGLDD